MITQAPLKIEEMLEKRGKPFRITIWAFIPQKTEFSFEVKRNSAGGLLIRALLEMIENKAMNK